MDLLRVDPTGPKWTLFLTWPVKNKASTCLRRRHIPSLGYCVNICRARVKIMTCLLIWSLIKYFTSSRRIPQAKRVVNMSQMYNSLVTCLVSRQFWGALMCTQVLTGALCIFKAHVKRGDDWTGHWAVNNRPAAWKLMMWGGIAVCRKSASIFFFFLPWRCF